MADAPDSQAPASTTSLYEEEVVEDDFVEEEVAEDDVEGYDEEDFVEEELVEEEVTETAGDVENPIDVEAIERNPPEFAPQRKLAPVASKPEKSLPAPKSAWNSSICLLLFLVIGTGAGLGYWVTTLSGPDVSILKSTPRTPPPTMAPSTSLSTAFDPPQGKCSFNGLDNPSPIDQCDCAGKIVDIAPDIRSRYFYNLEYFIPEVILGFSEDIGSCSPLNQALVWVSSGDDTKIDDEERTKRFLLATTFASLGGGKWTNNTNWLVDEDYCTWYGVTCSDSSEIESLMLDSNNLVGTIPSELSMLDTLKKIDIYNNEVGGDIPVSLFTIPTLESLDVSFNKMTGAISPAVAGAPALTSLNVESNLMKGRITRSIGEASGLSFLKFGSNKFLAELPIELFELTKLKTLGIGANAFTGTFPREVGRLTNLEVLQIGKNPFTGTIPLEITQLSDLKELSITGVEELTGRIPAEFGFVLNKLEKIEISETSVSGNIDTAFGRLPELTSINFSSNQLRSAIPSEFGGLDKLTSLDLSSNFLDGQIPESLGSVATLTELLLNNNLLTGGIPGALADLSSLETLRLEDNRLQDRVTGALCALRDIALEEFVTDCPIEIEGSAGTETFGVVCSVPSCCTSCVEQPEE